ncbi:F-box/FBD/LRR-repeat protein At1g13570-like [Camellia sinensis]|uniref:F-box/FBD/LRR-repeat protein At1g13570-like n=1 Tax=Camellia sinensis TaxID=4442 RepID=UPI00103677E8|nr:F-box/FBD/LRR-repeat protein At1g13570-like [Camellia sinensis]
MRRPTSDIISNLPESVKETILACLPIQDAVRTSVLSRKWRYTWTKLPQLVFDDTFCSDLFSKTKDKLMTIIYQVLLFHHGPIPKFTLSLSGLKSCSEFDQLILFVSKRGIQELNLNIQNGEPYKLPSSLFSCLQLKILTLHSCIFNSPPEFKGFSRLLELELYEVVVTADILSRLISSSPLLERLSLQNSTSIDCLEINAPNLRFLLCEIHAGSICLKNTVQLASVAIGLMASMDVEEFEISLVNHSFVSFCGCFGQLNDILLILCLIRSSPNLEKITIQAYVDEETNAVDPVLELLEMQEWLDVSLNQLQTLDFWNLSGTSSELEFIKLLLAISPVLEVIFIEPDSEKIADKGVRILKQLAQFPHLSPKVEIEFNDPDED